MTCREMGWPSGLRASRGLIWSEQVPSLSLFDMFLPSRGTENRLFRTRISWRTDGPIGDSCWGNTARCEFLWAGEEAPASLPFSHSPSRPLGGQVLFSLSYSLTDVIPQQWVCSGHKIRPAMLTYQVFMTHAIPVGVSPASPRIICVWGGAGSVQHFPGPWL